VLARNTLIRSNVRLVISIAKRWASTMGKIQHSRKCVPLLLLFMLEMPLSHPVWMKPFKEGILGLVGAADRNDLSRDLRFSTYSTYWITNFVRNCFTNAASGTWLYPSVTSLGNSNIVVQGGTGNTAP